MSVLVTLLNVSVPSFVALCWPPYPLQPAEPLAWSPSNAKVIVVFSATLVPFKDVSVHCVPSSSLLVGDVVAAMLAGAVAAGVLPLALGDAAGLLVLGTGDGVVGDAHADSAARQTKRTYSECFRINISRIAQQRLCE